LEAACNVVRFAPIAGNALLAEADISGQRTSRSGSPSGIGASKGCETTNSQEFEDPVVKRMRSRNVVLAPIWQKHHETLAERVNDFDTAGFGI
jgi:hypothetical protein